MRKVPWYVSPPAIFVFSLVSIIGAIAFYVYWSVKYQYGIERYLTKFNLSPDPLLEINTWLTILVYSLFIGVVLVGLIVIYVYYHRLIKLFRLQNNLMSNFTHELKTPITSIQLIVETMGNYQLSDSDRKEYLDLISNDCNRLNHLSEHILNTSKLESGGQELNFLNHKIKSWMENFLNQHRHLFGAEIEINFDQNIDNFIIDSEYFGILLSNIIINGIKYNESVKKKIQINFGIRKDKVQIHVIDNGIGINKTEYRNIFKKFYQVGNAMNMSAKGSGLGLYLSQMIANLHGGEIQPVANNDGGMCFTITVPFGKKVN